MPVLLVASWLPAADAPYRGQFVADQAAALAATPRARPLVVSFEPCRASGDDDLRQRQRAALRDRRAQAIGRGGRLFSRRGWACPERVAVARPPVAVGHGSGPDDEDAAAALGSIVARAVAAPVGRAGAVPVVHAHRGLPDGFAAAAVAERYGWPLVVTEHYSRIDQHFDDPASAERYRRVIAAAARVVVVSRTQGAQLLTFVPEAEAKLAIVPNAVAVDDFIAGPSAERVAGELLYVGNRKPDKGIALLLEALARARVRRPDLTLRLIGGSDTPAVEASWHALAERLGVADAVRFDSPGDRAEVAAAMARADLFVHASRFETFGVAAAEALAAGLPVVATDSGGVTEVLRGGAPELGAVVPRGDVAAFADAILRTLERRSAFDPDALRRSAAERYAAPVVAGRLLDLYEEVRRESRVDRSATADVPGLDPALTGLVSARRALRALLVAFGRRHAAQVLGTLDPAVRSRLTVLTASGDESLPDGTAVREVDLDEAFRAALREPGAERWRRLPDLLLRTHRFSHKRQEIARRRVALGLPAAAAAVGAALREHPGAELVALDAFDHLAIREAGGPAEPGGLRWLADGWAAGGAIDRR